LQHDRGKESTTTYSWGHVLMCISLPPDLLHDPEDFCPERVNEVYALDVIWDLEQARDHLHMGKCKMLWKASCGLTTDGRNFARCTEKGRMLVARWLVMPRKRLCFCSDRIGKSSRAPECLTVVAPKRNLNKNGIRENCATSPLRRTEFRGIPRTEVYSFFLSCPLSLHPCPFRGIRGCSRGQTVSSGQAPWARYSVTGFAVWCKGSGWFGWGGVRFSNLS